MYEEMSERRSSSIPVIELPSSSSERTTKSNSPTRTGRNSTSGEQEGSSRSNIHSSPTRPNNGTTSVPSAAAVQRALSVTKTSTTNNDSSSDVNRERRQKSGPNTPQWPTSPRLKSPPPLASRAISGRRPENDQTLSNTSMRRLAPVSAMELGAVMQVPQDISKETAASQSSLRPPGRGVSSVHGPGLETVAENSVPGSPSVEPISNNDNDSKIQLSSLEQNVETTADSSMGKDVSNTNTNETTPKTNIEKTETAPSSRATSTSRPATNLAKRSLTSLTAKNKPAVEPLRTMTVETETVNSTPQLITDRGREGGSVRAKPSTETIRPKKEKKRPSRKTPSLHAGMNSSKADIFEAKVASAVDEADSSDSDETFVYESNPPEVRHGRHHSRTPSANSMTSQLDHYGARGKHGLRSNSNAIGGKKSMKFSNSMYNHQLDAESAGDGRSSTRTTGSTARHHHISRHGRNGHGSIIDNDSPFTQANRSNSPRTPTTRNSRPSSPRTSNGKLHFSRKGAAAGYDAYDDAADDERAPLIGSVRVNRNRHSRRPNSSQFRALHFEEDKDPGWWPRLSGCCFIGFVVTLVCIALVMFIVVLNRPLMDVEVVRIKNVLASEEELMLDLEVTATNQNLFTISINELDVNVFAESAYGGTALDWKKHHNKTRKSFSDRRQDLNANRRRIPFWFPPFHSHDGVDEGNDPIDDPDPEPGTQKLLLGSILHFNSPLVFDPSPIHHDPDVSTGELRLKKPGERETGGTERWERVLQHEWELIMRGVLKYQLPLGSIVHTVKIGSRIKIFPGGDSKDDNSTIPNSGK